MIFRYEDAPERVQLTERELLFLHEPLPFKTPEGEERPIIDFVARTSPNTQLDAWFTKRVVLSDRDADIALQDLGEFEITYNFPDTIRNNVVTYNMLGMPRTYGKAGMSMRMLYEMLCMVYNENEYFVDTYFEQVFPSSYAYAKLQKLRRQIIRDMARELYAAKQAQAETLGKRASAVRLQDKKGRVVSVEKFGVVESDIESEFGRLFEGFGDFSVWRNKFYFERLSDIGNEIREDIISALSIGLIPLRKAALSNKTIKRRESLGINSDEIFYATGRLIDSLNIYVNIDKEVA